jgi:hypothetical protein
VKSPAVSRALLGLLLVASAGCGLLMQPDPIGFRTYVLKDVDYEQAVSIVREITRDEANRLFGGVGLTWDPRQGNLTMDPVYDSTRRLRLYVRLTPVPPDVHVEMFALVDHLQSSTTGVGYTRPMQDVPFEEMLFDAYVAELLQRRESGS